MASLLDIAPGGTTVPVRGLDVSVPGVSAEGIAVLFIRFPAIRALFMQRKTGLTAESMLELGPEMISAIIAAGCGAPGEPEFEKMARSLNVNEQADVLAAVIKATMPDGIGPFVKKLEGMGDLLELPGSGQPGKAPDMKSPKASKR